MKAFHCGSHARNGPAIDAEQSAALDDEKTAEPLAAAKRRIAHGFQKARFGAGRLWQQCVQRPLDLSGRVRQRRLERR
jgi:hypothetical protein